MVVNSSTSIWVALKRVVLFLHRLIQRLPPTGLWAIKQLSRRFNDKQTPCMKHISLLCVIVVAQLGDAS